MTLTYDNIDGSWRYLSTNWPKLIFNSTDECDRAFIACSKGNVVPYGSYVRVDNSIRLETEELKLALHNYLSAIEYKTFDTLKAFYISTGQWNN